MPEFEVHETFRVARRVQAISREPFKFVDDLPRRAARFGVMAFANASATSVDLIRNSEGYELESQSKKLKEMKNDQLESLLMSRGRYYRAFMRVSVGDADIFSLPGGDRVLGMPVLDGDRDVMQERSNLIEDIANISGLAVGLSPDYVPLLGLATIRMSSESSNKDFENLIDFVSEQTTPDAIDIYPMTVRDAKYSVAKI